MGCETGMGATHLSIALANYLSSNLGMNTALVELGERNALIHVSKMEKQGSIVRKGLVYFPQTKGNELGRIMNQGFQYVILDLGVDSAKAREEFLRCDGKIIIGSLCPWRRNVYYDYIKKIEMMVGNLRTCTFLSLFGEQVENKKCRRICKIPVKSVPFIANPFYVKDAEASFLHSLI